MDAVVTTEIDLRCNEKISWDYVEGKLDDITPKIEPVPITFDLVETRQIKNEPADLSEDYNVSNTVHRLETPIRSGKTYKRKNKKRKPAKKKHACHVCTKSFSTGRDLGRHLLIHAEERPFSCNICDKSFKDSSNLKKHSVTHMLHSCDICTSRFADKSDLESHMIDHTGESLFSCDICTKVFTSKDSIKFHMLIHTRPYACGICTKRFPFKSQLKSHLIFHSQQTHPCGIFTKAFASKNTHKPYQVFDTREEGSSRDLGAKTSTSCDVVETRELKNKTPHLSEGNSVSDRAHRAPVRTEVASKPKSKNLQLRVKILHICHVCTKTFISRRDLERHMRTHTGERPFSCDICTKAFSDKCNLKRHMLTHNKE